MTNSNDDDMIPAEALRRAASALQAEFAVGVYKPVDPAASARWLAHVAVKAAAPAIIAAEREQMAAQSIAAIAQYVLSHRDGEARGVTEFVTDLLEGQP